VDGARPALQVGQGVQGVRGHVHAPPVRAAVRGGARRVPGRGAARGHVKAADLDAPRHHGAREAQGAGV